MGKSNLFDAIRFLSTLADKTFLEAAMSVRDEGGRGADVRSLFHHVENQYTEQMSFEVEMIVPSEGIDDLGQKAEASKTFLRYTLILAYRQSDSARSFGSFELLKEELGYIGSKETIEHLRFNHSPTWRKSIVQGKRNSPLISTEGEGFSRVIKIHQDGTQGRTRSLSAASLPRTVLSTVNAAENPTALLARREMQSWRLLHLEPSALRKPDEFTAPTKLSADGSHLASTLYRLAHPTENGMKEKSEQIYAQIANRLAELIEDVHSACVDRDEKRELLTLQVTGRDGTFHPARSLSDGTLRFLALAVLELDPEAQGLLCLEEPENGIHPERIQAILRLLQDIATDANEPVNEENLLRQVIINTHSPSVVLQTSDDSLLVAELKEQIDIKSKKRYKCIRFGCLPDTWRARIVDAHIVSKGKLLSYLNPLANKNVEDEQSVETKEPPPRRDKSAKSRRVMDREDLYPLLPFPDRLPTEQNERDFLHAAD